MGKETIKQEQMHASFQVGMRAGEGRSQEVALKARLKDRKPPAGAGHVGGRAASRAETRGSEAAGGR